MTTATISSSAGATGFDRAVERVALILLRWARRRASAARLCHEDIARRISAERAAVNARGIPLFPPR